MSCIGCSTGADGKVGGCKSNGGCSSGGCNRMNTYDWISVLGIDDPNEYLYHEVSFRNGTHKEFFKRDANQDVITGDWVVVETTSGQDVGKVSLSGELTRLQMKKKGFSEDRILYKIVRHASDRDLEHMQMARDVEKMALVKGRVIARSLGLDMKLSDVSYQADLKKGTFYYIADRRIDFRELVKLYAKEFRIKIEMRQIGARQESARVGGIGSCGRELCCSTWLSDFKTVVTSAARYQNLAINQTKLSGQCGRLKCCLNYELDAYMESLQRFPMDVEYIQSRQGRASLFKTDIFRGVMYYELENSGKATRESMIFGLSPEQVKEFKAKNDRGIIPDDFGQTISAASLSSHQPEEDAGFADVTGEIELPEEKKRKKNKNRNRGDRSDYPSNNTGQNTGPNNNYNRPPQQRNQNPQTNRNQNPQQGNTSPNRPANPQQQQQNRPPHQKTPQSSNDRRPSHQNRPPRPEKPTQNQSKNKSNDSSKNDA